MKYESLISYHSKDMANVNLSIRGHKKGITRFIYRSKAKCTLITANKISVYTYSTMLQGFM
jgi:hypothetical protein